jgi:malonyl-CoA/methylmalonyl-CoA synthetase
MIQLIANATQHSSNEAIQYGGSAFSYQKLLAASHKFASLLLNSTADLQEARVAFMVGPGFDYVMVQWAIWRSGGIAVPLCITYPLPSLQYVIEDTAAEIVIASEEYAAILAPLAAEKSFRYILLGQEGEIVLKNMPEILLDRRAMILYTSGTTNLPKGVVTTHANLNAQISTLVEAWQWSESDHILCILPLHHVHGTVNVVSCSLWSGATVEFLPSFSAEAVYAAFLQGNINLFMAVPTIYFKLIAHWEGLPSDEQKLISETLANFRLMVSGSAALPVSVMEKWRQISGHTLLERYGMTEIGMGISNPYEDERKPGHIGQPLPGVKVRLVDEQDQVLAAGNPGEIQIKGPSVFKEYWNNLEATQKAFTDDGWFKTGDIAIVDHGYYRILGRDSIDIIKSGGYKISALEIEEILRTHPLIDDCGVVGIPDEEWGELVVAVLTVNDPGPDPTELKNWLREKLPGYKTPRHYKILAELPRNVMGKVTKNDLKKLF